MEPSRQNEDFFQLDEKGDIFKQMFQFSIFPIIIHDTEMNIIDASNKTIEAFGYSKKELLQKTVFDLHTETELEHSMEILEEMKTQDSLSVETSFKRKDGSVFFAEVTPRKYILGDKHLIHVTIKDITKRKENEANLIKAIKKAEESDRLKSAFLANMSHEIRTPLNAIVGFSSLLKETNNTIEDIQKYNHIITSSSDHLLSLLNDIIDISKIDAGQIKVVNSNIDLNNLLKTLYHFFHSLLISKNKYDIHLKMSIPDSQYIVFSDETRLRQILINLIGNAMKFTEKGKIEFGYEIEDEEIKFFVSDTGIGIPADKQNLIFNRFQQANKSTGKVYGGTGLGLAISKACTELLGGRIWVESKENIGTTFFFTTKYKPGIKHKIYKNSTENLKYAFNNELILIAEDDEYNFEYMKTLLREHNLRIARTISGRETIKEALENDDLSLILMDIQMPDLSGIEATIEIVKHKPQLPIIAQTAYAFQSDRERCLQAGCTDFIAKPIDKKRLLDLIHENIHKANP